MNNNNNNIIDNLLNNLPDNVAMMTKVWGPPTWFFLHSMSFAYPKKIDELNPEHVKIKKSMFLFLSHLGNILPCPICGISYNNYIRELNIEKYLDTRANLVYLIYLIHEKVNDKLGVPKCDRPSFEEVIKYHNKFRARGNIPCKSTTHEDRVNSLLAGCNEKEMKLNKFKNYKCIVNVIDKNNNILDKLNKENFDTEKCISNNNFLCIVLIVIIVILLILLIIKFKKN